MKQTSLTLATSFSRSSVASPTCSKWPKSYNYPLVIHTIKAKISFEKLQSKLLKNLGGAMLLSSDVYNSVDYELSVSWLSDGLIKEKS